MFVVPRRRMLVERVQFALWEHPTKFTTGDVVGRTGNDSSVVAAPLQGIYDPQLRFL